MRKESFPFEQPNPSSAWPPGPSLLQEACQRELLFISESVSPVCLWLQPALQAEAVPADKALCYRPKSPRQEPLISDKEHFEIKPGPTFYLNKRFIRNRFVRRHTPVNRFDESHKSLNSPKTSKHTSRCPSFVFTPGGKPPPPPALPECAAVNLTTRGH